MKRDKVLEIVKGGTFTFFLEGQEFSQVSLEKCLGRK